MLRQILRTTFILSLCVFMFSCQEDNNQQEDSLSVPPAYTFSRDGESSVAYPGQTIRLKMGEELLDGLLDFSQDSLTLQARYANQGPGGGEVNPFEDAELNQSSKSLRAKTAASRAYFASNASESSFIRQDFQGWISSQVTVVFPAQNQAAQQGQPGQIADGSGARYINARGLEYNQMVGKSLIGALFADQMINNYLSPSVLDEADNRSTNDEGITAEGKAYTTMEHKWDEAYGYLFGLAADGAEPLQSLGQDDSFLNKYLARVDNTPAFNGIAQDIYNAFKRGRAAIVAGDYAERDAQAAIIQEKVSRVLAVRAVHYLKAGATQLRSGNKGSAFHSLSEGLGFIYSLRFTHDPQSDAPYFSPEEVGSILSTTYPDQGGFWTVKPGDLDSEADKIAQRFGFAAQDA